MDWKKVVQKSIGLGGVTYEIPNRWLHIHYYDALNVLFRIENSLRVLVYIVLKNEYLDKWADSQIETIEKEQTTISALAKKRITQAQDFGYLGYEISSPLMHLNSGELVRLITSEKCWRHFAKYFKGRKEIIKNKLDEIGSIRNSLAHFRPIKDDDVDTIKQNAKHVLVAVEASLKEITSTVTIVPTNTTDAWYQTISTLEGNNFLINLYQSTSSEWLRIGFLYRSAQINMTQYVDEYISYQILNLKTPNIIQLYPNISKYVTAVSEDIPYISMPKDLKPNFLKTISFVFHRQVLSDNLEDIAAALRDFLTQVDTEEGLMISDHLASGKLIEAVTVSARFDKDAASWEIWNNSMRYPFKADHPAEYWGDVGNFYGDFIASVTKYPWMPSTISRFDI